jgi:nucleoside-diphosphate-sugar epimerase
MSESDVRVAITGGSGFLGDALSRKLLAAGQVEVDGNARRLAELVLLDVRAPFDDIASDERVSVLIGDLAERLPSLGRIDVVFHLAGVVSGAAEANFELGMDTNLYALIALLDWARQLDEKPVIVFTSSLAVFGQDPYGPIHSTVDDDTLPRPQSSYGVQKFIGEQLVADYTRRGFLRGRSVRLMTVSVRPGAPNAAASSFLSGIVREPLAGKPSVCPVPATTPVALSSPTRTVEGILRAAAVESDAWGSRTAMNLPALTTTPAEMIAALERAAPGASELVEWAEDRAVIDIVGTWPAVFVTDRAAALGLSAPANFDEIVEEYIAANFAS